MSDAWVFCHVRPGFENDCTEELEIVLGQLGAQIPTWETRLDSGFIAGRFAKSDFLKVRQGLAWKDLIFVRQLLWSTGPLKELPKEDRVTPILSAVQGALLPISEANAFSGFFFETPDADDLKELSGFCKSLQRPTESGLNKIKLLPKGKGAAHLPRLHLVMTDSKTVWPTFADVANSSPWTMGIPRLKFPANAPSRSTLKLEEAFHVFLGTSKMAELLKPGMTAVDLGASPGGWTFQLVKNGLQVSAVDNGNMDASLMSTGKVSHEREDAFRYMPTRPVDWLVCDVIEQPSRIAELMAQWLSQGWCKHAIFNLKLPMKQRYQEVASCLELIREKCAKPGRVLKIRCKQLYHDRKEVTVFCSYAD